MTAAASARKSWKYRVVDVFTSHPLEGNPLAVFPDGSGLDDRTMQRIAQELNLSETVFVFAPTQPHFAARLRIFTPSRELPFAGHPTIGTAYVLRDEGKLPASLRTFILEEQIGPVPVTVDDEPDGRIWLTTPPIDFGPTRSREACAAALGLGTEELLDVAPQILSAGNPTLLVALRRPEAVDRAWLEASALRQLRGDHVAAICVFVFALTASGVYSRMFAPEYGIAEDPATGSSTGPLAAYLQHHNLMPEEKLAHFISEQGTKMGRRSLLHVRMDRNSGAIAVGGQVTPLSRAVLEL